MRDVVRTPWGRDAAIRGALAALLAALVVCAVGAATDEGGVGWLLRVSRTLPLVPMCSGAGAYLALGTARSRGELRALAALGARPSEAALGAALGAASVSLIAGLLILTSSRIDVGAFYPTAQAPSVYVWEDGAFVDRGQGLRVTPAGEISRAAVAAISSGASELRGGRFVAALTAAVSGLAMALALARTDRHNAARTLGYLAGFTTLVVVLFQAAGARSVSPFAAMAAAGLMLSASAASYRARDASAKSRARDAPRV